MTSMINSVSIPSHGPPHSAALDFLTKSSTNPGSSPGESDLLKAIRATLSSSGNQTTNNAYYPLFDDANSDSWVEDELAWNDHIVILSRGGVVKRKWDFGDDNQTIRYACIAKLEQSVTKHEGHAHGSAHYTSSNPTSQSQSRGDETVPKAPLFGPFATVSPELKLEEQHTLVRGVYIFLRNIGRIYLEDGAEYTFSLPFLVRRAWPLHPHGVLVQRTFEPNEIEEAAATGEPLLPTIFSIANPLAEPSTIGITGSIAGGYLGVAPYLEEERREFAQPLTSVPAKEDVIWVSSHLPHAEDSLVVTLNSDERELTIWRYAYIKPNAVPLPQDPNRGIERNNSRKQRLSMPGNRRQSSAMTAEGNLGQRPRAASQHDSILEEDTYGDLRAGPHQPVGRKASVARTELSFTLDKMALGPHAQDDALTLIEHSRMKAAYWMQSLCTYKVDGTQPLDCSQMSVAAFDQRFDGASTRTSVCVCPFPGLGLVFSVLREEVRSTLRAEYTISLSVNSVASVLATRHNSWDMLAINPSGQTVIYTHGLNVLPVNHRFPKASATPVAILAGTIASITTAKDVCVSSVTLAAGDGTARRASLNFIPKDELVRRILQALSFMLPSEVMFSLHHRFLQLWSQRHYRTDSRMELQTLCSSLASEFRINSGSPSAPGVDLWNKLSQSPSIAHFRDDPALSKLKMPTPPNSLNSHWEFSSAPTPATQSLLAGVLYALHMVAEDLRMDIHQHDTLCHLAPLICNLAHIIRPEWADYWKRLCPTIPTHWTAPLTTSTQYLDDRIPVVAPDMCGVLYGRIGTPEKFPVFSLQDIATSLGVKPSYAFGLVESLPNLQHLIATFSSLAELKSGSTQKRAERAVEILISRHGSAQRAEKFLSRLPLGVAAPLREAVRTCQLCPPNSWDADHYELVGRRDLSYNIGQTSMRLDRNNKHFPSAENYANTRKRTTVGQLVSQAISAGVGEVDAVTGVELEKEGFTDIRFGQDRRLDEAARMFCSSSPPSVRIFERADLNEHDQAKEQQMQVVRIAERTLALPYGRAMFTYGSVLNVTREAYSIPKLDFSVRVQPLNIIAVPEPGKIPTDCTNWGEFHNGVAAGLRISPKAKGVESSWIAFNKPSELTPEHAGFLYALGLTGHLKEMLTWHTFGYLTPKHDLTSIGVLLGLSAANVGTGNRHVTKLLAVHTPALLPTQSVDLNVSLMTQAAGLAGVGLLYLGTKNRRMAEVCLNQISRQDLVQPDLSNEHREAYTYAAGLAFGMTMLGQGSSVPADLAFMNRLRTLIHGEGVHRMRQSRAPSFDVNITSPAATIALGLMYLKTERRDVADMLAVPDTALELNRIQPSFQLMRTLARCLIMWDGISPSHDWISSQTPATITLSIKESVAESGAKASDDAMELAYWNIVSACCFAIGLKFAGTARHEAYAVILHYFDTASRFVYANSPAFDHKIKRASVREGLNLISIALCMVMAGTGEISCFRRLRYAYGMYHQAFRYGVHVATHLSMGLLFLGGGRYTLGTSNGAIASMVVAFFPRFHHVSSDNKSYLQALRHLWVLAVEPRCLLARDVNTEEAVYLPLKVTGTEGTYQLISPTLLPDLDRLFAIKVDTPRYWPFLVDVAHIPQHRKNLLETQTLFVKRRTAFLSYTEDPKGSRSLFVRSGSSAGDAATLDFPQVTDVKAHPASDLTHFISSFSNDVLFLAFADWFSREDGQTREERIFHNYCHAALLDSILQDKIETLQSHLTLFQYRMQSPTHRFFHLRLQDLRFAADFYNCRVFDHLFSGKEENNRRQPLIRETTALGVLQELDGRLEAARTDQRFMTAVKQYARGEAIAVCAKSIDGSPAVAVANEDERWVTQTLAWYLLRNGVPASSLLVILKQLAQDAHAQCVGGPAPNGTGDVKLLDDGIREVLHGTGTKMTTTFGAGWSVTSLEDVIEAWQGLS